MRQRTIRTIVVDDEPLARRYLLSLLDDFEFLKIVGEANNGYEAIEITNSQTVDLAFLDVEMPQMSGLELIDELLQINGATEIILTTGFEQYALDAYKRHVLGYLVKPVDRKELEFYVSQARYLQVKHRKKSITVSAFGNFSVFVGSEPLVFANVKAKELLACLIDACGTEMSMALICETLWEDKPYGESVKALYRRAVKDLRRVLEHNTVKSPLIVSRASLSIDISLVNCDYYDYLKIGDPLFMGEYMEQYPWAEFTKARLALT
jgi:two-component SAPR family response regulator